MHYFTTTFAIMTAFSFERKNCAEETSITSANPTHSLKVQITCSITMCCCVKFRFLRNRKQND